MTARADTTGQRGSMAFRFGGKGMLAPALVPHLARRRGYLEPFFGAGGFFFRVPPGLYEFEAVNDLDDAVVAFFRVLRDRPDELIAKLALTPYAREEHRRSREDSADELEQARRIFVRMRQTFSGNETSFCWSHTGRELSVLKPERMLAKLGEAALYARRLLGVEIDKVPAVEFIAQRAGRDVMIYSDPPYPLDTRVQAARNVYKHEMSEADHRQLAAAHHAAVARGAAVMVSSYTSELYAALYAGWRRVEIETVARARPARRTADGASTKQGKRVEVLYMSYPASEEIGTGLPPTPSAKGGLEKHLARVSKRRLESA